MKDWIMNLHLIPNFHLNIQPQSSFYLEALTEHHLPHLPWLKCFLLRFSLGSVRDIDDSPFVRLAVLGNPNLKPATSENINFGFIWNIAKEVNLIIDYWEINYKDRIEAESPQVLLNTNPYAPKVTRNQFGELAVKHIIF